LLLFVVEAEVEAEVELEEVQKLKSDEVYV
jgi:hypothetical protein